MGEIMKRESITLNNDSQIQKQKSDKLEAVNNEIRSLDQRIANNKVGMVFALETHVTTIALFFVLLFSGLIFYYPSYGRTLGNVIFIYGLINVILAIPVQLTGATKQRNINDSILKSYARHTDYNFEKVLRDISPRIIGTMNYWLLRIYARNHFIFGGIAFCGAYLIPPIVLGAIYSIFMAVIDEDEYNKIKISKYKVYDKQYYEKQLDSYKKEIAHLMEKQLKDETKQKIGSTEIQRKPKNDI